MSDIDRGTIIRGYEFLRRINSGGEQRIYRCRSLMENEDCVIKIALVSDCDIELAWHSFDTDMTVLEGLDDPNIVKVWTHFRCENEFFTVMEYCPNGSLSDYIQNHGPLTGMALVQAVKGLCSGLAFAWSRQVVHQNVRPQNVLLDGKFRVKLNNFKTGLADYKYDWTAFAAPEVVKHADFNPIKADIWSLGITILTLATGHIPWGDETDEQKMKEMIAENVWTFPSNMNKEMRKLVWGMLQPSPEMRCVGKSYDIDLMLVHESRFKILSLERSMSLKVRRVPELRLPRFNGLRGGGGRRVSCVCACNGPEILSPMLFGRIDASRRGKRRPF